MRIDSSQRVFVWSKENKGKWTQVSMGDGEKQSDGEYVNNSWNFSRFVGEAHAKIQSVPDKTRIVLSGAKISNGYKDKETGKNVYAKNPTVTVFDFEIYSPDGGEPQSPPPPADDDDEIPF